MTVLKWVLMVLAAAVLLAVVAGQLGLLRGQAPTDLGVRQGKLKAPSITPNSVSSQADLWPEHPQLVYARMAPLVIAGAPEVAMARLKAAVQASAGAAVVKADGDYLYAQFTTPWMHYTDDVEFWFDRAASVVQVRSASRLGKGDLGANRKRIEALRAGLASP